jgi:hypothetical protein
MIACNSIQTRRLQRLTAEQVTATDHQANLNANPHQLPNFQRQLVEHFGVDTEGLIARQGLTTQLQEDAFINFFFHRSTHLEFALRDTTGILTRALGALAAKSPFGRIFAYKKRG